MTHPPRPRSPLWVVVLALACEEPMHPYRMHTLIKQRGKDQIANVAQRNSVNQTIDALRRAGLVRIREMARAEHRPERTIYEATDQGRQALRSWVCTGLSTPAREFPEFPAVLSTLYGLKGPGELRALLEERVLAREAHLAELDKPVPNLPRVFLLETEYMAAVVRAEVNWLRGVIADLRAGRLTFPSLEELLRLKDMGGPSEQAARRIAAEMSETSDAGKAPPPAPTSKAPRGRKPVTAALNKRRAKPATTPSPRRKGKSRKD
jgi:DNA-binding PadR family transcriptional regulator